MEQNRLISSLMWRMQRQEITIRSQSQKLTNQQLALSRQGVKIQTQSKLLETQQQLLNGHGDTILTLSQILHRHRESSHRHAGDSENPKSRLQQPRTRKQEKSPNIFKRESTSGKLLQDIWTDTSDHVRSSSTTQIGEANAKRLVLEAEGPVAFHAVIANGEIANLGINQHIVFDVVKENLGGAYNNRSGVFVAPANGLYIFSVSVLSYINQYPEVRADLKKDGMLLARVFGHGDNGRPDQGSVTVVSRVSKGSEVWVSLDYPSGDSIWGDYYTTFMGCLLYPQ